jgi:UDP-glucose 4-epimerase
LTTAPTPRNILTIRKPNLSVSSFLITGGAGFIGSHLVHKLVSLGHGVRVLDNLSTGRLQNLHGLEGQFEWINADAANPTDVENAMKRIDGVFHLAAVPSVHMSMEEPLQNQRSGEVATLVVLDAARRAGVKRVVYSSSSAVYGDMRGTKNREEMKRQPLTFYGLSKLAGEGYCRVFSYLYPEFDTVSLRYFNVFGARQSVSSSYSGVISIFTRCLLEGVPPTIFGDGRQSRDFIEVSNIVAANIAAMDSESFLRGECFNVGTGTSLSIFELWNYLAKMADSDLRPQFAPARAGDIRHSCANIAKIQKYLGWRPKVDWKKGLTNFWSTAATAVRPSV